MNSWWSKIWLLNNIVIPWTDPLSSTSMFVHKFHSASSFLKSLWILFRYHCGRAGQITSFAVDAFLVLISTKRPTIITKMPTVCMIINDDQFNVPIVHFLNVFFLFCYSVLFYVIFTFNEIGWMSDNFHSFVLLRLHWVT